jgi:hypothetical protein
MREPRFFPDPDLDRVVAMVMDLAAQLHVERLNRICLETVLLRQGVVTQEQLDALAIDQELADRSQQEVDRSLRELLAGLLERDDAAAPLRPIASVMEGDQ